LWRGCLNRRIRKIFDALWLPGHTRPALQNFLCTLQISGVDNGGGVHAHVPMLKRRSGAESDKT
jgi:hypothetical protein